MGAFIYTYFSHAIILKMKKILLIPGNPSIESFYKEWIVEIEKHAKEVFVSHDFICFKNERQVVLKELFN